MVAVDVPTMSRNVATRVNSFSPPMLSGRVL